jgi:transcriptional regulator of arginine metabolism
MTMYIHAMARFDRHRVIQRLLSEQSIDSQHELRDRLAQIGIEVTQATLSRDLRAMGIVKAPTGWVLPDELGSPSDAGSFEAAVRRHLLWAKPAASLVVVRTRPGHADALAIEFDRWPQDEMVGTIAGDDTIFIATESEAGAALLASRLERMVFLDSAESPRSGSGS